jgi:hypothetical protein
MKLQKTKRSLSKYKTTAATKESFVNKKLNSEKKKHVQNLVLNHYSNQRKRKLEKPSEPLSIKNSASRKVQKIHRNQQVAEKTLTFRNAKKTSSNFKKLVNLIRVQKSEDEF